MRGVGVLFWSLLITAMAVTANGDSPLVIYAPHTIASTDPIASASYISSDVEMKISFKTFFIENSLDVTTGNCTGNHLIVREQEDVPGGESYIIGIYCGHSFPEFIEVDNLAVIEYVVVNPDEPDRFSITIEDLILSAGQTFVSYEIVSSLPLWIEAPPFSLATPSWFNPIVWDVVLPSIRNYYMYIRQFQVGTANTGTGCQQGSLEVVTNEKTYPLLCGAAKDIPKIFMTKQSLRLTLDSEGRSEPIVLRIEIIGESTTVGDAMGYDCRRTGTGCLNDGACNTQLGKCDCDDGFRGHDCGLIEGPAPLPEECSCENGATCYRDPADSFVKCYCAEQFAGGRCELNRLGLESCQPGRVKVTVIPFGTFEDGQVTVLKKSAAVEGNQATIEDACQFQPSSLYRTSQSADIDRPECIFITKDNPEKGSTTIEVSALVKYNKNIISKLDQFVRFRCIAPSDQTHDASLRVELDKAGIESLDFATAESAFDGVELKLVTVDGGADVGPEKLPQGTAVKLVATLTSDGFYDKILLTKCTAYANTDGSGAEMEMIKDSVISKKFYAQYKSSTCEDKEVTVTFSAFKFMRSDTVTFICDIFLCSPENEEACMDTCDGGKLPPLPPTAQRFLRRQYDATSRKTATITVVGGEAAAGSDFTSTQFLVPFAAMCTVALILIAAVIILSRRLHSSRRRASQQQADCDSSVDDVSTAHELTHVGTRF